MKKYIVPSVVAIASIITICLCVLTEAEKLK